MWFASARGVAVLAGLAAASAPVFGLQDPAKSPKSEDGAPAPPASPRVPGAAELPVRVSDALDVALDRARARWLENAELREDHTTFETAWEVTSPHFRVRAVHSRTLAAQVCSDLEQMLPKFQQVLGTSFVPAEPLPVFVLRTLREYNTFGDQHGDEHSSFSGAFYAPGHRERPVAILYNRDPTYFRATLTHSVAHQYIDAAFGGQRTAWFDEGVASYFALYWSYGRAVAEWERMRTNHRIIPMNQLLTNNIADFSDRPRERQAQLGLLFTWLMWRHDSTYSEEVDGELRPGSFAKFMRAVVRGGRVADQPFMTWMRDQGDALAEDFAAYDFSS